jgi:hypothetical protein
VRAIVTRLNRWIVIIAVLATVLVPLGGGCRNRTATGSASGGNTGPAATPAEALVNLLRGMQETNFDEIAAVTKLTDEQKGAVQAGVNLTRAAGAFRDAFIAAYGSAAWADFQDPAHRPGDHDTSLLLITDADIDNARKTPLNINGDRAIGTMPYGRARVILVKTPKGWMVDGSTFVPEGTDAAVTRKKIEQMADAIRKYQRAIGKPGLTPGAIDAELGLALDEVVLGRKIEATHRFDVDKL